MPTPGFGLNYNQGFGSSGRQGFTIDNSGLYGLAGNAWQNYNSRQADERRADLTQQGWNHDSAMQDRQLAQRNQESTRDYAARMAGIQSNQSIAAMQANASKYPHQLRQTRWNQVFPMVQEQLGSLGGGGGGSFGGSSGGGGAPAIDTAPIWNADQIQQNVNASRASADAGTAGQVRGMQQQMAGRGFGSRSPLAALLGTTMQMGNLASNTGNEQQMRWNAAQGNAEHVLAAQTAKDQGITARQDASVRASASRQGALAQILGALLGAST